MNDDSWGTYFPAISVLVFVAVSVAGFGVCEAPKRSDSKRSNSELVFLLFISILESVLVVLGLGMGWSLAAILAFAVEVGFCFFELLYLSRSRDLPIPASVWVHHIATPICVQCGLLRSDWRLLAKLSFAMALSAGVLCVSKLVYRRRADGKGLLLQISFFVVVVFRLVVPGVILGSILVDLLTDPPPWARLYATSALMLWVLNAQMAHSLYCLVSLGGRSKDY